MNIVNLCGHKPKKHKEGRAQETYTWCKLLANKMNRQFGKRVVAVPRDAKTKRIKTLDKYIKNLCTASFYSQLDWNSEYLDISDLRAFPDQVQTKEQVKASIERSLVAYLVAKTDPAYRFLGKRDNTVSVSDFMYSNGFSQYWYYLTQPLVKSVSSENYDKYFKGLDDNIINSLYNEEKMTYDKFRLALGRLLKWYIDTKDRIQVSKGGIIGDRSEFLQTLHRWKKENNWWGIPFPEKGNVGWDSFMQYLYGKFGVTIGRAHD